MIVYVDGIFDLFHRGHLESFKFIKEKYPKHLLHVGVINDSDSMTYKRKPIINESDRMEIIKSIKYVDKVIYPAPLIITEDFIKLHKIDLIVHGFSSKDDEINQQNLFKIPIELKMFKTIPYYSKISTTDIINNIKNNY